MSSTLLDSVALNESLSAPVNEPDRGFLYTKEISNITELFYIDDTGQEIQITNNGEVLTPNANPNLVETTLSSSTDNAIVLWDGTTAENIKQQANIFVDQVENSFNSELPIVVGVNQDTFIGDGYLQLKTQVNDPDIPLDGGKIYTKLVLGVEELFYIDGYGQAVQITTDGYVKVSNPIIVPIVSGNANTSNTTATGIGITNINTNELGASATYTLEIALQVTNASFAGNFELFNITEGVLISGSQLSTSSLGPTLLTASLTVGTSDLPTGQDNLIEARIYLDNGAGVNDRVFCKYAAIKVI